MTERVTKIENIDLSALKPWAKNPRNNEKAIADVVLSIQEFGFTQPILIDQNNRIVAGHTRYFAAKELKMINVPCVRKHLTEEQYVACNLADNKTGEKASWDKTLLKECMEILGDIQDIKVPGFTDKELDKLFGFHHEDISKTPEVDDADFGNGVKVSSEGDDRALVKRKVFMFTNKEYKYITDKLKAIKKEHDLDTEAEAFIEALRPYKGLTKVVKKTGQPTSVEA